MKLWPSDGISALFSQLNDFTFTHWRRQWQPTPVFLPGESQGWRSLVGCRLWGRTESDTTDVPWQQQQQQCKANEWRFLYHLKTLRTWRKCVFLNLTGSSLHTWSVNSDFSLLTNHSPTPSTWPRNFEAHWLLVFIILFLKVPFNSDIPPTCDFHFPP